MYQDIYRGLTKKASAEQIRKLAALVGMKKKAMDPRDRDREAARRRRQQFKPNTKPSSQVSVSESKGFLDRLREWRQQFGGKSQPETSGKLDGYIGADGKIHLTPTQVKKMKAQAQARTTTTTTTPKAPRGKFALTPDQYVAGANARARRDWGRRVSTSDIQTAVQNFRKPVSSQPNYVLQRPAPELKFNLLDPTVYPKPQYKIPKPQYKIPKYLARPDVTDRGFLTRAGGIFRKRMPKGRMGKGLLGALGMLAVGAGGYALRGDSGSRELQSRLASVEAARDAAQKKLNEPSWGNVWDAFLRWLSNLFTPSNTAETKK